MKIDSTGVTLITRAVSGIGASIYGELAEASANFSSNDV